jgi:PilZ domain
MSGRHEDRRRWARTSPASGAYVTIARAADVELLDISGSGVLLAGATKLRVGQRAQLRLLLRQVAVVVHAEIVRVEQRHTGTTPVRYYYGARFTAMDDTSAAALRRFLGEVTGPLDIP